MLKASARATAQTQTTQAKTALQKLCSFGDYRHIVDYGHCQKTGEVSLALTLYQHEDKVSCPFLSTDGQQVITPDELFDLRGHFSGLLLRVSEHARYEMATIEFPDLNAIYTGGNWNISTDSRLNFYQISVHINTQVCTPEWLANNIDAIFDAFRDEYKSAIEHIAARPRVFPLFNRKGA